MGFLDRFRSDSAEPAEAYELAQISYAIAYIFMPKCLYSDPKMTIDYFSKPKEEAAALWYWSGCKIRGATPRRDHGRQFQVHTGSILSTANCYILEYPKPPPFDAQKFAELASKGSPAAFSACGAPVLAPYFSGVVHEVATAGFMYVVMGQSMVGGTTLRRVDIDGSQVSLGNGSEPTLDAFLSDLRKLA